MKKYLISILVIVITIGIYSCKKENTNQPTNNNDELMVKSNKIITLIKQFDEKMKSTLKTGERIEVDSAVWNMEALQNYTYANPDTAVKDFVTIKTNYLIDIDTYGTVLLSDVQFVYSQMATQLLVDYNSIESDEKVVRFADVALDSIVGSTAYLSTTLGFGFNWIMGGYYWGFDEDDDWLWGADYPSDPPPGKCDGTQVGVSDGSDELQWRLNNPLVVLNGNYIFTNLEPKETAGFDWNYRLYVGWNYPENNCLTNDTLTYYLLESHDIIHTYIDDGGLRPAGKSFSNVEIIDELLMSSQGSAHFHNYEVTYGVITLLPPHQ